MSDVVVRSVMMIIISDDVLGSKDEILGGFWVEIGDCG